MISVKCKYCYYIYIQRIAIIRTAIVDSPMKALSTVGYRGDQGEVFSLIEVNSNNIPVTITNACHKDCEAICPTCLKYGSIDDLVTECYQCWRKDNQDLTNKMNKYRSSVSSNFYTFNRTDNGINKTYHYYKFSLIIQDIDYSDEGEYQCHDLMTWNTDSFDYISSNSVNFNVKG